MQPRKSISANLAALAAKSLIYPGSWSQKTNPDIQRTISETQLTIPSIQLTTPDTQLTSPGTRPPKKANKCTKIGFFCRDLYTWLLPVYALCLWSCEESRLVHLTKSLQQLRQASSLKNIVNGTYRRQNLHVFTFFGILGSPRPVPKPSPCLDIKIPGMHICRDIQLSVVFAMFGTLCLFWILRP